MRQAVNENANIQPCLMSRNADMGRGHPLSRPWRGCCMGPSQAKTPNHGERSSFRWFREIPLSVIVIRVRPIWIFNVWFFRPNFILLLTAHLKAQALAIGYKEKE